MVSLPLNLERTVNKMKRYVVTHINKDGMRTLAQPMQGRYTYETPDEAQSVMTALLTGNSMETIRELYGLPFEVRSVEVWPGHFDPKTCWFD